MVKFMRWSRNPITTFRQCLLIELYCHFSMVSKIGGTLKPRTFAFSLLLRCIILESCDRFSTFSSILLKIDLKYMGQNIFSIFVLNDHNSILKLELNTVSYCKRTVELDNFTMINSKNY